MRPQPPHRMLLRWLPFRRRWPASAAGSLALPLASLLALLPAFSGGVPAMAQAATQATAVPLLLPGGLAFDASGDLIFAETGGHAVRMVSPAGVLTTVAGDGVQGFAGDGGPATAAELDSPAAVALDAQGNLYIADTHNHRIRRVDAVSHTITTVAGTGVAGTGRDGTAATAAEIDLPVALAVDGAGNLFFADARAHLVRRIAAAAGTVTTVAGSGVQGFSGDGGPATAAALDSPYGLALDAAGDLFIADTHNQRVRRVDAVTRAIATVAGNGVAGFAGDAGAAQQARLALPRGLALDAQGDLFLVDAANQRIRRVDAATGQIGSVAGEGTQGFGGDGGPATAALVNAPHAVAISPAGLATLADTSNGRVRQVDAAGVIHTYAGLGALAGVNLSLSGPAVVRYGTGTLAATLTASAATGPVTLLEETAGGETALGSAALSGNVASFPLSTLSAGTYRLEATYAGDATHAPAESPLLSLTVQPAPVTASVDGLALLYGQPVPALTGALAGVLPQDAAGVSLALSSGAAALSPPGTYPIRAALAGPAAGNYTLSATPATVSIAPAPAVASLMQAPAAVAAQVTSTTSGMPTGIVTLLDGGTPAASLTLASGSASFPTANLSVGTHTLTAAYQGDVDFRPVNSAPLLVTVAPAAAVDFTLTATGQTAATVSSGAAAEFSFAVIPGNGALSSPVELAAAGLPAGAVASFNPAYLPPSGAPAAFILTVQTPLAALDLPGHGAAWALLLPVGILLLRRRKFRPAWLGLLLVTTGCGDRIYTAPAAAGVSYNVTVTASATGSNGTALVHAATVVLTVQ